MTLGFTLPEDWLLLRWWNRKSSQLWKSRRAFKNQIPACYSTFSLPVKVPALLILRREGCVCVCAIWLVLWLAYNTSFWSSFLKSVKLLTTAFWLPKLSILSPLQFSWAYTFKRMYFTPSLLSFSELKEEVNVNVYISLSSLSRSPSAAFLILNMLSVSTLLNSLLKCLGKLPFPPGVSCQPVLPKPKAVWWTPQRPARYLLSFPWGRKSEYGMQSGQQDRPVGLDTRGSERGDMVPITFLTENQAASDSHAATLRPGPSFSDWCFIFFPSA